MHVPVAAVNCLRSTLGFYGVLQDWFDARRAAF